MIKKIAPVAFVFIVAGLLFLRRFDMPVQLPVVDVQTGEVFHRGDVIKTNDVFRSIKIGDDTVLAIDKNSTVELHRLFDDERVVKFTRGRILIEHADVAQPFVVETNKTESVLTKGRATFINYDFQQTVQIVPLNDSNVQLHIKGSNEYMLVPVAVSITEQEPITFARIEFNPQAGEAKAFYEWVGTSIQ